MLVRKPFFDTFLTIIVLAVTSNFEGSKDDFHLPLSMGEIVVITGYTHTGWFKGAVYKQETSGFFPFEHVHTEQVYEKSSTLKQVFDKQVLGMRYMYIYLFSESGAIWWANILAVYGFRDILNILYSFGDFGRVLKYYFLLTCMLETWLRCRHVTNFALQCCMLVHHFTGCT